MINPDSASLAAHTSHGDSATSQNDPIFWPLTFRSGLTILSSYAPVHVRGRILVRYAMIDSGPAKFRLVGNPYLLELCRNCFYVFL